MRSPINKLIIASVFLLTIMAGMNSDCTIVGQTPSSPELVNGTPKFTTEVLVKEDVAESRNKESESMKFEFKFPNIFDIFRSIF